MRASLVSFGFIVTAFAIAFTSRMKAQDVSVTGPTFYDAAATAGLTPPQLKGRLRVSWPDELTKNDQPSYVIAALYVDDKGKRVEDTYFASNNYFFSAVKDAVAKASFEPAKSKGKPTRSVVWVATIFNPRSAKETAPDASPRLLAVSPVVVPKEELKGGPPPTIWTTFQIDETGAISIKAFDQSGAERFRTAIEAALPQWKFAPAKKNGVVVVAEVHVPVQIQAPPHVYAEGKMVFPKAIHQEKPIYPIELRKGGMKGEVVVMFTVDSKGNIIDPVISRSTNPAFDQPAIEALLKWKFLPGTRDGKPVNTKMLQPISFSLSGLMGGGSDAFEVSGKRKDREAIPDELRYDVSPQPKGVLFPVYPYTFLADRVGGKVKMNFLVDEGGHVSRINVIEATKPEFGLAMSAAVEAFQFTPALKNGKPIVSVLRMEQTFDPDDGPGSPAHEDWALLRREQKHPETIFPAGKNLDHPLKPLSRKSPVFPSSIAASVSTGEALIEILIDQEGRARLPRIVSATDPAFGYAGVQAIYDWRFEPPTVKGEAVVVRARVPFTFKSADSAPSAADKPPVSIPK